MKLKWNRRDHLSALLVVGTDGGGYTFLAKGNVSAMDYSAKKIGGSACRVQDCRVWAEISYLDSDTDYREYLPNRKGEETRVCRDMILLDDLRRSLIAAHPAPGWVIILVVFIAAAWIFYLFLQSL